MSKVISAIDVRDLINKKLEEEDRSVRWLHKKTGINYNTLYSCLVRKHFLLSESNLKLINQTLGTKFKMD